MSSSDAYIKIEIKKTIEMKKKLGFTHFIMLSFCFEVIQLSLFNFILGILVVEDKALTHVDIEKDRKGTYYYKFQRNFAVA